MPITFKEGEIQKIVKFFKALEGRMPKVEHPQLPKTKVSVLK